MTQEVQAAARGYRGAARLYAGQKGHRAWGTSRPLPHVRRWHVFIFARWVKWYEICVQTTAFFLFHKKPFFFFSFPFSSFFFSFEKTHVMPRWSGNECSSSSWPISFSFPVSLPFFAAPGRGSPAGEGGGGAAGHVAPQSSPATSSSGADGASRASLCHPGPPGLGEQ